MGRTACTEPQCLYKGALYLTSVPVQGCTLPYLSACTSVHFTLPQCLYKGALYLTSVRVQGCTLPYLSACTRVHFTLPQCLYKGALYLTSVPVQGCTLPYTIDTLFFVTYRISQSLLSILQNKMIAQN